MHLKNVDGFSIRVTVIFYWEGIIVQPELAHRTVQTNDLCSLAS